MVSFVKVDTGILDSTLWANRDQRDVFLTALLMAVPFELDQPVPQMEVDSLAETGFLVPIGWYGFVGAAGRGILRKALVNTKPGMKALGALGQPDPESRSKDYEGRRLVRIEGGYIVLNYIKYRERDYTAAERAQRYRDRQKGVDPPVTASRRDGVTSRRDITQAEAEAEAEAYSKEAAASGPPPAAAALVPALPMANGVWTPPEEQIRLWCVARPGLDVRVELQRIAEFLRDHPKVRYGLDRLIPWVQTWLAKEAKALRRKGRNAPQPAGASPPPSSATGARASSRSNEAPHADRWKPTWPEHEATVRESGQALKMAPDDLDAWVAEVKTEWDECHEEAMC